MSMITDLDLQDKVVIGGEEIAVFKWQVQNHHLQQYAHVLSRLQMAILEMDSNNSTGGMVLADSESINSDWKRAKFEWTTAKKWRTLAPAAQEKILSILAITDNEQLRTVNVKCRRVVTAIGTLIQKVVFCDSAKMQYQIEARDIQKLEDHASYVEELLLAYVGSGADIENVGMDVAAHEHLGVVNPPINLNEATVQEPSPAGSNVPGADAPDTPSTVPAPGTSTGNA